MDFSSVQEKVVIITGAGSGIGKAIAIVFAKHNMKVVCADYSTEQGQATVDTIVADGGEATFIKTDCTKMEEIKTLVEKTIEHYKKLDGIINNAGIGMGGLPLHEHEIDEYEQIFNVNSKGVFAGMKYGAEAIFKSNSTGGFIINIASIAGLIPQRGQALYTATKFGVVGMTKAASLDYAKYGITVNAICPGYTKTNIFGDAPEQAMNYFANDCPAGRMGEPEECAYLALFLASNMARYITGAAIPVDGALSAGSKNVITWRNPEILTGGKLSAESTISVLMKEKRAIEIIEKYLPGFSQNEQAKAVYGMTFGTIAPMLGLPEEATEGLLKELNEL